MASVGRCPVPPPTGLTPRPEDTPRTRQLKELRTKRLAYFESQASSPKPNDVPVAPTQGPVRPAGDEDDVRASMVQDSRVRERIRPASAKLQPTFSNPSNPQVLGTHHPRPSSAVPASRPMSAGKPSKNLTVYDNISKDMIIKPIPASKREPSPKISAKLKVNHDIKTSRSSKESARPLRRSSESRVSKSEVKSARSSQESGRRKCSMPVSILKARNGKDVSPDRDSIADRHLMAEGIDTTPRHSKENTPTSSGHLENKLAVTNQLNAAVSTSNDGDGISDFFQKSQDVSRKDSFIDSEAASNVASSVLGSKPTSKVVEPEYETDYTGLNLSSSDGGIQQLRNSILNPSVDVIRNKMCADIRRVSHEVLNSAAFDGSSGLEHILGEKKMQRLLRNLEESDWTLTDGESHSGLDRSHDTDLDFASIKSDNLGKAGTKEEDIPIKPQYEYEETLILQSHQPSVSDSQKQTSKSADYLGNAEKYIETVKTKSSKIFLEDSGGKYNSEQSSEVEDSGNGAPLSSRSQGGLGNLLSDIEKYESLFKQKPQQKSSRGYVPVDSDISIDRRPEELISTTAVGASFTAEEILPEGGAEAPVTVEEPILIQPHDLPPPTDGRHSREEHIAGIKKHIEGSPEAEIPEPLPPGEYSSPSIERYFSSLADLSREDHASISANFEPVPDSPMDVRQNSDLDDYRSNKQNSSNRFNEIKPTQSKEPVKSEVKAKTFEIRMSLDQSMDSSCFKQNVASGGDAVVNNNKTSVQNHSGAQEDEDSLTQVSSMTSGQTSLTERLKRFGIEKPFRNQLDAHDILSDASQETGLKIGERRKESADQVFHSFITNNDSAQEERTDSSPELHEVLDRSHGDLEDVRPLESAREYDSLLHPVNMEMTSERPPVVLGTPRSVHVRHEVPLKKVSKKKEAFKVCPECGEYNKAFLTWCKECGVMLDGEDPIRIHSASSSSRNSRRSSETSIVNIPAEAVDSLMDADQGPVTGPSKREGGKIHTGYVQPVPCAQSPKPSTSGVNTKSYSHNSGSPGRKSNKEGLDCGKQDNIERAFLSRPVDSESLHSSSIRDSANFEYENQAHPAALMPPALKAELSINLNDSGSNFKLQSKQEIKRKSQLVELSEQMDFEYLKAESPTKGLSEDLQAELSLDLQGCLEGSNHSAMLAKQLKAAQAQKAAESQPKVKFAIPQIAVEDELDGAVGGDAPDGHQGMGQGVKSPAVHDIGVGPGGDADPLAMDMALDVYEDADDDDDDTEVAEKQVYQEFLQKLAKDPRFNVRPKSGVTASTSKPQPSASKGRPKTAGAHGSNRPKSAMNKVQESVEGEVSSKVKASLEAEPYQRHWQRSSVAWGSYQHGEVKDRSELLRSSGVKLGNRSGGAGNRKSSEVSPSSSATAKVTGSKSPLKSRPSSAGSKARPPSRAAVGKSMPASPLVEETETSRTSSRSAKGFSVQRVSYWKGTPNQSLNSTALNTYAKYIAMSPRVEEGDFSVWLCLPDEIWLHIFSYVSHFALARCAQVCQQFNRIALDDTLWRRIVLRKKSNVTDEWLAQIGKRSPVSLNLIKCQGHQVSEQGLRELFRQTADSLQELNFSGCSRGQLTGDHILLHAAARCRNITTLDCSWTNANDNGVVAMAENCLRLEKVVLNGCQSITDEAVHSVTTRHGLYLSIMECFGCFNLTARSASCIRNNCNSLTTLDLGQCWKLTDTSISQLSSSLGLVEKLDLRGCKQMKDACVQHVITNCPRLQVFSVANCPSLTDATLVEIGNKLQHLRSLDVCGCKKMTNAGLRSLAMSCPRIVYLDVSSTGISHKGVSTLANYCSQNLEVLKVNFCKNITVTSLIRLAKHCGRLRKLFLYGVTNIRSIEEVQRENSNLLIEM